MTKLNWYWVYSPYLDAPEKQAESATKAGYAKVCFKSEADEAIRRQKYKRCLRIISDLNNWIGGSFMASLEYYAWLIKWRDRWMEIANKFKEDK